MPSKTFYITTAIDYPNSNPHIGHAYEKIVTDVLARWKRLNSLDVFFLTGTDENGQKLQEAAEARGLQPQQFVDNMAVVFKQFASKLNLSNDGFVRTTDSHHKEVASSIFQKVLDKKEIYKGTYEGWHCIPCETYYTEKDLVDGKCPKCGRAVKVLKEEAYFFKLGKYQKKILAYIKKNPKFIYPESRRNEILQRLENDELRDLCVSRSGIKWGIPLPNNPNHVIYVWFDALINYISGLGPDLDKYWPANVHVIGKDILWFHTVIWPGMLFAAGIKPPKQVYVHGFINDKNGEKMSKSKGNVVDPISIVDRYGSDVLKYYFLRSIGAGQDGNFSEEDLVERYNTELANELGNLISRTSTMVEKFFSGRVPKAKPEELFNCKEVLILLNGYMDNFEYNKALEEIFRHIKSLNKYVNEKEPWKVTSKKELAKIMYTLVDGTRLVNILLQAFIPETSAKIRAQYNLPLEDAKSFKWKKLVGGTVISKGEILFPKKEVVAKPVFLLNLKVGEILSVNPHPNADKLYLLRVNIGHEIRLVAGVKQWFKPEELLGKKIIVVSNLKPAKLRGEMSEGMLLAAEHSGKLALLTCDDAPGASVGLDGYENNTTTIEYDAFLTVKLEVKSHKVFFSGKELKTEKHSVSVKIEDGAQIR
ncbi:MAG: methionine--tRNA ligase [Candidatus Woesearchaeota archaeon]